ncbi:HD family phosphohydrolase [Gloeobacter kilaueensis]|uniref:Metal dependent phosphohydrolase n=1 Tax=Gloeobacter kilaueensis (strain ATCC BAA-2537 / CCAP 1431/1 / ULC 316 / JS1) TaxID=1183438 RepID=U5QC22_GLOK1|nr:HDIG domain-containing metalloprotein [Gloeobacter kilaueensis]AGY56452.1 metal dependent phosphohydrolase [Gloeobacter kilaueensis JS1]
MSSSLPVAASSRRAAGKRPALLQPLLDAPVWFVLAIVLLTSLLGLRFYREPQLAIGKRIGYTLLAPKTMDVEDRLETEKARLDARRNAVQIYSLDPQIEAQVHDSLDDLLTEGDQIFATAGSLPYIDTGILASEAQRYLRAMPQATWLQIKQLIGSPTPPAQLSGLTPIERQIFGNLNKNRAGNSDGFAALIERIERARLAYGQAIARLRTAPLVYQDRLLDLSPDQWKQVTQQVQLVTRRLLAMGVIPGLPQPLRESGVMAQLPTSFNVLQRRLATDLVLSVLTPNLKVDRLESFQQAERTAENVPTVRLHIQKGQVLLKKGEMITPRWFDILDRLQLTQRGVNWLELLLLVAIEAVAFAAFLIIDRRLGKACLCRRDYLLTLVIALFTSGIGVIIGDSWGWGGFLPFIAAGLWLGNFYGSKRGSLALLALAVPFWYGLKIPFTIFLPVFIGGLVAALLVGRLRSREEMAFLGVFAAAVQGAVYALLTVVFSNGFEWGELFVHTLEMAGGGLVCSIVALGASPYLERLFDVITSVRLSELANPNRPLLKRLATEAPGTFQHTLFVANLAEAAAQCLGDNADLVRAGTLYHDIGKMVRPRYFIENQMGLPNPHLQLDDPWRSAAIIRDHVTDGLKLARRYGLPQVIQNFIPEHQGTIQIAYFHHQACELVGSDNIREEDFRYPGPIPQSRETGLVMLADACEAALRSLKDVTEGEAVAMVQRILAARWREGQLKDSGLKEEELPQIARIFVKVWKEQNHQRIRYPSASPKTPEYQVARR